MKKLLLMSAILLLPNVLFADDYVIIDGERRLLVRLEFEDDRVELTAASAAAFAEVVPMFTDGSLRRYELHGNFCADEQGGRRHTVIRTERVFEKLIEHGVRGANITTTINVAPSDPWHGCPHDRRVDIMTVELRRVRKSEIGEEGAPAVAGAPGNVNGINDINDGGNIPTIAPPTASEMSQPSTATAQAAPRGRRTVAVYMAGTEPPAVRGVHGILGGELTRVISSHENFIAVDRTDFILAALEDEHDYQRSGMVDDEQIQALGRQLGVEFLCISNIIAVGNGYYIDTRLVDVVTAEVVRSITATSSLRDGSEKMRVARDIANELVDPDRASRCGVGDDTRYDPAHQFCFGGRAYNLCGGSGFNPQTQGCLPNQEIGTLCADGTIVTLGTHCGQHTLSVAVAPPTGGTVIRAPDAQTYSADATVALSAVAGRGFTFAGWAGAQTSNAPSINITMTRAQPVIAMFRPEDNNALITTAFPSNGGTISRSPESDVYQSGEVVRVSATPNLGFEFVGWEGAQTSQSADIEIFMNEGKALVAIFRPILHTLNAVAMPDFGGSVFINGTALSEVTTSEFGFLVEAFARPAPGYVFTGWTGAAFGTENPVMVDLTRGDVNVIANFAPVQQRSEDENLSRVIAVTDGATMALPIVATESQEETQTNNYYRPHELKRQNDHFFALKWMPPVSRYTQAGWGFNLEYGQKTRLANRWFSIDAGFSQKDNDDDRSSLIGASFNYGTMREFANNLHVAYGLSGGFWYGDYVSGMVHEQEGSETLGFMGPIVRLRWQYFEVTYRGLIGLGGERDGFDYDRGLGFLSQLMIGTHFRTNRRTQN